MITHDKIPIPISTKALLNSGANIIFIDRKWAEEKGLPKWLLCHPISMYNIDGTKNSTGQITHCTDVTIMYQGHKEQVTAEITDLGWNQMILGYMWLKCHNSKIDWEAGTVKMTRCPKICQCFRRSITRFLAQMEKEEQESAWHTYHLRVTTEILPPKTEKTIEELVPKEDHKFLKVFSKGESQCMPLRKPWDHAIDLKNTFQPKKGHIIPLFPAEQEEVSTFIDDQLWKGYIRPSKSEQTSPVFFVPKKDGKKWMVQDYRYLNDHTVKNNYPLPLIS